MIMNDQLPAAWTDISSGLTREQVDNVLAFRNGVTVYLDRKPVAVLLSAELRMETNMNEEVNGKPVIMDADLNTRVDEIVLAGKILRVIRWIL